MTDEILVSENFIEELAQADASRLVGGAPTCDRLIRFFCESGKRWRSLDEEGPLWKGRTLSLHHLEADANALDEEAAAIRAILALIGKTALQVIMQEFHPAEALVTELTQIVAWPEGTAQGLHHDLDRPETRYAGILYLNHDFSGGETFFPGEPDLLIAPRQGQLLVFDGVNCSHGVKRVNKGTRYTVPMWFGVPSITGRGKSLG